MSYDVNFGNPESDCVYIDELSFCILDYMTDEEINEYYDELLEVFNELSKLL